MSIPSGATRKAGPFTGNGVTTAFPFSYKVFAAADVLVVRTDLTPADTVLALTVDYTVALNPNQDSNPGGSVVMNVAPPLGYLLTLGSQQAQVQPVVLTNTGGFFPTVLNNALDFITILVQQLSEKMARALTLPFSTNGNVSAQLPPVSPGSLLGWNAAGTGLTNAGGTGLAPGGVVASNMAAGATGVALSSDVTAAATKVTPASADEIPLYDSASGFSLKSLTWTNQVSTLSGLCSAGWSALSATNLTGIGNAAAFGARYAALAGNPAQVFNAANATSGSHAVTLSQFITGLVFGAAGAFPLPGGTLVKFGNTPAIAASGSFSIVFPVAFPNGCEVILTTASSSDAYGGSTSAVSSTGATVTNGNTTTAVSFNWLAIGY